jgi:hypothetical protein
MVSLNFYWLRSLPIRLRVEYSPSLKVFHFVLHPDGVMVCWCADVMNPQFSCHVVLPNQQKRCPVFEKGIEEATVQVGTKYQVLTDCTSSA